MMKPLTYGIRGILLMMVVILMYIGYVYVSKSRIVSSIKEGHGKIEQSMSKEHVVELLGTPYDIDVKNDTVAVWKYKYSMSTISPKSLYVVFVKNKVDSTFVYSN